MQKSSTGIFGPGTPYGDYKAQSLSRVNERYKHIITANIDHIAGKRILDLAAHDGRWTWAALKSGAGYVEGVEGRQGLVEAAKKALAAFPADMWKFSQGDIFAYLDELKKTSVGSFDTILCLGIFYHINEHVRLLGQMAALKPSAIILDGALMTTEESLVSFALEPTGEKLNAIAGEANEEHALVGTASRGLLGQWSDLNGWQTTYIPWTAEEVEGVPSLRDYSRASTALRARFTCILTPLSAAEHNQRLLQLAQTARKRGRKNQGGPGQ